MYSAALQPNVFELAAMTQELDTLLITSKVKEILQFHNLGQKLFGEAILGLSQGSVSELLSKPKPWHMLSLKGREPFIKMHLWLNDPHNIDRLRFYQNELKANRKRRCSLDERGTSNDSSLGNSLGSNNSGSNKKARVFFSEEQKDLLRMSYNKDPYPSQARIEDLANTLGVGTKTIVNWFHNHRMRAKQVQGLASPSMVPPMQHPFGVSSGASTKSEQWEGENSNASEMSSSPSETGGGQGHKSSGSMPFGGAPGSPPDVPGAQWMFPRFEPLRKISSASCDESAQDLSRSHDVTTNSENEAEDLSVRKSSAQSAHSSRDDDFVENDAESQSAIYGDSAASGFSGTANDTSGANRSVSRRKKSRPQWVFEGTQLEKSREEEENVSVESPQDGVSVEKAEVGDNRELMTSSLNLVKSMKNNNCGETSDGDSNANESAASDQEEVVPNEQRKRKLGKVELPFMNSAETTVKRRPSMDNRIAVDDNNWEDSS